ncbi:hypothetical protein ACWC98_11645 [Streptomyces goshikiensis]
MTVSEQGDVAFDYSQLTAAERSAHHHDPDGQATVRTAVSKWQKYIDNRVRVVSEADTHIKDILEAPAVDSNRDALGKGADETLTGFNNYAEGDLANTAKRLRSRGTPTSSTPPPRDRRPRGIGLSPGSPTCTGEPGPPATSGLPRRAWSPRPRRPWG